jgi:hypothetical protein
MKRIFGLLTTTGLLILLTSPWPAPAATNWTAADGNWETDTNWDGGVPDESTDAVIDVDGAIVRTVTVGIGNQSTADLTCAEDLDINGGNLTVYGVGALSGGLSVRDGYWFESYGVGATTTIHGPLTVEHGTGDSGLWATSGGALNDSVTTTYSIDGANLRADSFGGDQAIINFDNLTSYSAAGVTHRCWFWPKGNSSQVNVPNLTTITGNNGTGGERFELWAEESGRIDASGVTTMSDVVYVFSSGTDSLVDLSSLTSFADATGDASLHDYNFDAWLDVYDSGVIALNPAARTTLTNVRLYAGDKALPGDINAFEVEMIRTGDGRGDLTGHGTLSIQSLINTSATVAPGDRAEWSSGLGQPLEGTCGITGHYTQGADGALEISISEMAAGGYDLFEVGGDATLAGRLTVALDENYVPQAGDSFVVLTAAGVDGDFDVFDVQDPGGVLAPAMSVTYDINPTDVTVSIVPEPLTLALLAVGGLAMTRRR